MSAGAFVSEHLRSQDFDWYAALLFAPADKREALMALFAFLAEIEGVRARISDPMPGEIRLQWWRDALSGNARGDAVANPLAASLLAVVEAYRLPTAPLVAVLDARTFDLYDDAMPSRGDLEGYAGEIWSGPMALAAGLFCGRPAADFADLAGHGGVALTLARVLQGFPVWSGRGQCYLPADLMAEHGLQRDDLKARRMSPALAHALCALAASGLDHLEKARLAAARTPQAARPLWLPLALARRTLQAAESWARNPYASALAMPRWRRLLALWQAARTSGAP